MKDYLSHTEILAICLLIFFGFPASVWFIEYLHTWFSFLELMWIFLIFIGIGTMLTFCLYYYTQSVILLNIAVLVTFYFASLVLLTLGVWVVTLLGPIIMIGFLTGFIVALLLWLVDRF